MKSKRVAFHNCDEKRLTDFVVHKRSYAEFTCLMPSTRRLRTGRGKINPENQGKKGITLKITKMWARSVSSPHCAQNSLPKQ